MTLVMIPNKQLLIYKICTHFNFYYVHNIYIRTHMYIHYYIHTLLYTYTYVTNTHTPLSSHFLGHLCIIKSSMYIIIRNYVCYKWCNNKKTLFIHEIFFVFSTYFWPRHINNFQYKYSLIINHGTYFALQESSTYQIIHPYIIRHVQSVCILHA